MTTGGKIIVGERWTKEEFAIVEMGVTKGMSTDDIAALLPNRTWEAVKRKMVYRRQGVPSQTRWLPNQNQELRDLFGQGLSDDQIAERMGRTVLAVRNRRIRENLLREMVAPPKRAPKIQQKRSKGPAKMAAQYGFSKPAPIVIDGSLAAQAARHLMRDYKPVCRRSTVEPKADKDLWIVGRQTLTTAELIEKAESRGFGARIAA